ncbi:MAG: ATP-binding cassette domain-containing protein [Spirochaetales bacterium]|nr:ATP-binding cassette domain-containing protein [Spirochaetales bacterium]
MNIVSIEHISKYFSVNDTQALSDMSLEITKGEIHAVVGENGAGKSTLMKIIHGVEKCDSGNIKINGKTGMVSQHFRLIESLNILENIIIGMEPIKKKFIVDKKKAFEQINEILVFYGFSLNLNTKIKDLSIGQKQLVEIIKVIYNDSDILIFDEPTAALSELEAEKFRKTLLSLKEKEKTIIIISHKIKDISAISDRFTIMRKGRYIETVTTKSVDISDISRHMSGTEIVNPTIDRSIKPGKELFSFIYNNEKITLHESEIIGITGYGDCGLHELEDTLEELSLNNKNIGYVPSDRLSRGVELNSALKETLVAKNPREFSKYGLLNWRKIDTFSKKLITEYNIKGTINCQTGTLSGGNLQKSVIARVLYQKPETYILCSPTWGIDIESANNIYHEIESLKKQKKGILLLSYDAEEVIKMSNRVYILYKGRIISTIKDMSVATPELIGKYSSGIINE